MSVSGARRQRHASVMRMTFVPQQTHLRLMLQFRGVIKIRGINPYILVDAKMARRLKRDWRKPLPVLVRINGQPKKPWRVNMMPASDGSFYLFLQGAVRKASGTKVGDRVIVELSFDKGYQGGPAHAMPRWFHVALGKNPRAQRAWNALIPSRKKEILRYFAALKSPEAKARNLRRAIEVLSEGAIQTGELLVPARSRAASI